jgi:hypothetical protein
MNQMIKIIARRFRPFFSERFRKISDINEKYSKPRLVMHGFTPIALFLLRIYLLFLVTLLVVKFIQTVKGGH